MNGIRNHRCILSVALDAGPRFAGSLPRRWPGMARGRKPATGKVSQIHLIIPEDVQDYMARMGSMDSTSKIKCLLTKAIQDRIPKTEIELKGKMFELERARRNIGNTTRECTARLLELGWSSDDIDKLYQSGFCRDPGV